MFPAAVIERGDVFKGGNVLQVDGQPCQLPVFVAVLMGLTEGSDLESILGVHEEVAAQVVEHDGVLLGVVLVLAPNHTQWLNL